MKLQTQSAYTPASVGQTIYEPRGGWGERDTKDYENWKKELKKSGYSEKARPYEFNQQAFQDPTYRTNKSMLQQALNARQGMSAPTMNAAQINMSPQDQFRNYQMGLANQLMGQTTGKAPSLADMQLRQGIEQSIAAQRAMGLSGSNQMLGMRNAQAQIGQLQAGLAGQAAQSRLQEQLQAQQALAGLTGAGREQDIGLATSQAGLTQQASELNLKSQLAEQAMKDQMTQYYISQGLSNDQAQWQAQMELEKLRGQQHSAAQQTQVPYYVNSGGGGGAGSVMGATGGMLAGIGALFSDVRLKENISTVNPFDNRMNYLDQLKAAGYNDNAIGNMMAGGMQNRNMGLFGKGRPIDNIAWGLGNVFSDKNLKENIKGKNNLRKFMDGIRAYQYNYKFEKPSMKRIGVMAQDMEKSKLGKTAVLNIGGYKAIDGKTAISLSLASIAELNRRLKDIEKKRRS